MSYHCTTLANGLRVASEVLPGVETVSIAFSVDVGARYEHEEEGGISHLLEHMAFKGTKTRSAREIAESFDAIGGHINAYTSLEHTVYYAKVLKEYLPQAVEMLSDILLNSTYDAGELEKERHVILQEIAAHHDTPDDLVFDYFQAASYPDQPLGRSILGEPKRVESYLSQHLHDFTKQYYTPKRMVVSAAGSVDHEQLVKLVAQHFPAPASDVVRNFPQANYAGSAQVKKKNLEQLHVILGFPSVTFHDDAFYAANLLSIVLGGGMSSRLFQEIREKRGLVYSIYSTLWSFADTGVMAVYAATSPTDVAELVPVLCDQMLEVTQNITEEELQRAKNQHKANMLMSRESTSNVTEWIGRHLLQYDRYIQAPELLTKYEAITVGEVQKVAQDLLTTGTPCLAALGGTQKLEPYEKICERLAA